MQHRRYSQGEIWQRQLAFLIHGGMAPSNAVSQLILAIWVDLTVPDELSLLRG